MQAEAGTWGCPPPNPLSQTPRLCFKKTDLTGSGRIGPGLWCPSQAALGCPGPRPCILLPRGTQQRSSHLHPASCNEAGGRGVGPGEGWLLQLQHPCWGPGAFCRLEVIPHNVYVSLPPGPEEFSTRCTAGGRWARGGLWRDVVCKVRRRISLHFHPSALEAGEAQDFVNKTRPAAPASEAVPSGVSLHPGRNSQRFKGRGD